MKEVSLFQAEDGSRFENLKEAKKYEAILNQVNAIPFLNYEDDNCSFANGGGYIQQSKGIIKMAEDKLLELANEWFKPEKPFTNPRGIVGRYCCDSNMKALNRLYSRLQCIDSEGREWGQPYFANNPGKGTLKRLK
jgi:hypothetical protein